MIETENQQNRSLPKRAYKCNWNLLHSPPKVMRQFIKSKLAKPQAHYMLYSFLQTLYLHVNQYGSKISRAPGKVPNFVSVGPIFHQILCLTTCDNRVIKTIITSGRTQDFVKKQYTQSRLKFISRTLFFSSLFQNFWRALYYFFNTLHAG